MKFLRQFMNDKRIENKYVNTGAQVGEAISYSYMGECLGFKFMVEDLKDWEQEYVDRGYKTVSIKDFENLGGYGKSIDDLLGQKLEENEEPILHAQSFYDLVKKG